MKQILILSYMALSSFSHLFSQVQKTKQDTLSIILNGEHISVPVPKEGNKTTINLEDSASIIQISVGKSSKLNRTTFNSTTNTPALQPLLSNRRISWFNELEFGVTALTGRRKESFNDTGYGFNFSVSTMGNVDDNRATMIKLTPKTVNPGFSAGLSIREKSRPIGHSGLSFITGSRFRYSRFTGRGNYDIREIKAVTTNGIIKYYPDSVYSVKSGEYRTVHNSFSFLFPFLVSRQVNENFTLAAGMNLALNINSSKISENIKDNYSLISYMNPQILMLQPVLKATVKKTSVYLSYSLSRTIIGYGATDKITGNTMYFGMAYKLY